MQVKIEFASEERIGSIVVRDFMTQQEICRKEISKKDGGKLNDHD